MLAGALDAGKKIGDTLQEAAARLRWSQQSGGPRVGYSDSPKACAARTGFPPARRSGICFAIRL
jgi:hypothetical protein